MHWRKRRRAYRDAQDALDNREYAGINAESYDVLMRRRNAARDDLDAMLAASPVAPAGVPTDELHQQIMNLPINWTPGTSIPMSYLDGHRDARHAAAELVCALLSAGAPAVPLQDSVHSHLAAPGSTVPSALTVGTPRDLLYEIMNLPAHPRDLPGTFMSGWISGHKEARHQAAELVVAALPIQCDGRDGVTGSAASSEAREAISSSSGSDGPESAAAGKLVARHRKACFAFATCEPQDHNSAAEELLSATEALDAALRAVPHQPTGERNG
jgi:hypothetical protein